MDVQLKKLPRSEVELTVIVPKKVLEESYAKTLADFKKTVAVPGFRKGMAPDDLVVEKVGKDQVENQVISDLLPLVYLQAVAQEKINPVKDPVLEIVQKELGQDLIFKAIIPVLPEVSLGDWQKLKVKKAKAKEVTNTQVDEALKKVLENAPKDETGGFIYDQKGEKVPLSQEATDSFAEKLGFKDLSQLKSKIKEELEGQENYLAEKEFEEKIFEELLKNAKMEVPVALIEDELNRMIGNFAMQMAQSGVKFEDYLTHKGKSLEAMREEWQPQAKKNIKVELVLREVANREKVEVSEEEISKQFPPEHSHKQHTPEEMAREVAFVKHALKQNKALNIIKEKASK